MEENRLKLSPAMQLVLDIIREVQSDQKDIKKQTSETHTEMKLMNQKMDTIKDKTDHAHTRIDAHEKEHKWVIHTIFKSVVSFVLGGGLIAAILKIWSKPGG